MYQNQRPVSISHWVGHGRSTWEPDIVASRATVRKRLSAYFCDET